MKNEVRRTFSRKGKVFITGIGGFIGSHLAQKLHKDGYVVGGLIRHHPTYGPTLESIRGKAMLFKGDLRDYYTLRLALEEFEPDYIVHLGAITPVSYSFYHPQEVTEVNYLGTINLAEAARETLPNLKRFVFASTMEVYGVQDPVPFTEDIELKPNCPYAVAKRAAELYLQYMWRSYKFPFAAIRGTNCYGRKHDSYFVVEAIVTRMLENPKEIKMGRGEPVRNFIYIDDMVDAYQTLMETDNEAVYGEVFNVGPANGLSIRELVEKIARKLDWHGTVHWDQFEIRPGEIFYLNSKNDKIKKYTGWEPKISLDEGLDRVITYWKKRLEK